MKIRWCVMASCDDVVNGYYYYDCCFFLVFKQFQNVKGEMKFWMP